MAEGVGRAGVIDADSHVTEPPDLFTSRVPRKWVEVVPRVETHPRTHHSHWRIGDSWLQSVGYFAMAGWDDYPPFSPFELADIDPASYEASARLTRMDQYGLDRQILYPNVIGFAAPLIWELGPGPSVACVRAYNDFVVEFAGADPRRLLTIAMLPFWDLDATVEEMRRCAGLGFKGFLFANKFEKVGLPPFTDGYWDRVYATAQDMDLPINYHIGFATQQVAELMSLEAITASRQTDHLAQDRLERARSQAIGLMSQGDMLAAILTSGLCDRFPSLKLVSVESGFGYVPYLLEALDWMWKTQGAWLTNPTLPSEYFRRQCYGTFWFEQTTLPLLTLYPDNFMFSTDFPHPISLSPGPCSPADVPGRHIDLAFSGLDPEIARKALSGNAERIYNLGGGQPA
jgi:predicted TIM-barrel fold metal-dependent hydrolase